MKSIIGIVLFVLFVACHAEVDVPNLSPENALLGKWILTDVQAPGIGPAGVWSPANPKDQWIDFASNGTVRGNVYNDLTTYVIRDSVTIQLTATSISAGIRLFNYHIDTANRFLFLYIRPSNGGYCFEGCGTLKFKKG